jgi:hypothetical protein
MHPIFTQPPSTGDREQLTKVNAANQLGGPGPVMQTNGANPNGPANLPLARNGGATDQTQSAAPLDPSGPGQVPSSPSRPVRAPFSPSAPATATDDRPGSPDDYAPAPDPTPGPTAPSQRDDTSAQPPRFASNLGIYYDPVKRRDKTYGLRVVKDPLPGTPAARLQLGVGDVILKLNGKPIRSPDDVLNRRKLTTVEYFDMTRNERRKAKVMLP